MLTLQWPDGSLLAADTASDAIAALGAEQWNPRTAAEMRMVLVDRAFSWSGVYVDPELPDDAFLEALSRARMFVLTVDA